MAKVPKDSIRYRCRGPCGELFPKHATWLGHLKGSACKGHGYDPDIDDGDLRHMAGASADEPPVQSEPLSAEEPAAEEPLEQDEAPGPEASPEQVPAPRPAPPVAAEAAVSADDDKTPTTAGGGQDEDRNRIVIRPSTGKEQIWLPSAVRAFYDGLRAMDDPMLRFEGDFTDFITQSVIENWERLGFRLVVILTRPAAPVNGQNAQQEVAAHA